MAPELNNGEGAAPSGWGAALGSGETLGPTYEERAGIRWLGTDGAAQNRGGCGGDGSARSQSVRACAAQRRSSKRGRVKSMRAAFVRTSVSG
jgi:hypothetical protein